LPFYILVLGPVADVGRYLNRIEIRFPEISSRSRRVIFTERLVRRLGSKPVVGPKREGFGVEASLIPGANLRDDRVLQLQVPASGPGKAGEPRHIEVTLDCELMPLGLDLDPKRLRARVQAESPGSDGKFQPDAQATAAMIIPSIQMEGNRLRVALNLVRDQLRTGHDYRFEVRVYPDENAYQLPRAFQAWDLSSSDVEQILKQQGFGRGKPGRTLNLGVFLQNLRDSTFLGKEPPIAVLYFYVKAT